MNTDNQTAAPHQAQPDAFSDSPHSTPPESPANPVEPSEIPTPDETSLSTWRHNGKVARLPKALRDKINLMLQDGATYPAIINTLGEAGKDLNVMNLSRWKDNGYKDWLLEQSWLNQTRARQEPASDLSTDFDATQLNHAALQLATLHMFEALRDLTPSSPPPALPSATTQTADRDESSPLPLDGKASGHQGPPLPSDGRGARGEGKNNQEDPTDNVRNRRPRSMLDFRLGGDSAAFVRLINALARASRETMLVQKYRDACTRARAALLELKDPNRKLNERETRAIVRKVDEILGFCSPEDDEPEPNEDQLSEPARNQSSAPIPSSPSLAPPNDPPPFTTTA